VRLSKKKERKTKTKTKSQTKTVKEESRSSERDVTIMGQRLETCNNAAFEDGGKEAMSQGMQVLYRGRRK
jgi:hypothetical protein